MKLKLIFCCMMVNVLVNNASLNSGTDHMNTSEKSFQKTGFYLLTEKDSLKLAVEEATQMLPGKHLQLTNLVQYTCAERKVSCSSGVNANHRLLFVGSDSTDILHGYILCKLTESDTTRSLTLRTLNGYKGLKVINSIPFDIHFVEAGINEIVLRQRLQKGAYGFVKESQFLLLSKRITIHSFTID